MLMKSKEGGLVSRRVAPISARVSHARSGEVFWRATVQPLSKAESAGGPGRAVHSSSSACVALGGSNLTGHVFPPHTDHCRWSWGLQVKPHELGCTRKSSSPR